MKANDDPVTLRDHVLHGVDRVRERQEQLPEGPYRPLLVGALSRAAPCVIDEVVGVARGNGFEIPRARGVEERGHGGPVASGHVLVTG